MCLFFITVGLADHEANALRAISSLPRWRAPGYIPVPLNCAYVAEIKGFIRFWVLVPAHDALPDMEVRSQERWGQPIGAAAGLLPGVLRNENKFSIRCA